MKTRNLNMSLLVTIICILLMPYSIVFGNTVWDITDDFSVDNGNPNGPWSYGWMDTDFTNFTLFESGNYTGGVPPESPIWYTESTSPKYGCVWKNTGPYTCGVDTGQLSMHPGVGGYYTGGPWPDGGIPAVSRWTAPEGISGLCTIEGQFSSGCYDNTIQVSVRINSTQVWYAVDSGAFNLSTTVAPGDTIDFVVYGGYNSGGNTPLDATITIFEPAIAATVDIDPNTLNLQSKGKWITCYINLPADYNVVDINSVSVVLNSTIKAEWTWVEEEEQMMMAKFSRSAVQDMLQPGQVELRVSGELIDGRRFEGTDTINVINEGKSN